MAISGKTAGILARLPHFYQNDLESSLLALFADIFARRLERAEIDLYQVLHSHHVETAENDGFQGYTAPPEQRGDLDKIFALYLEALGGTALLVTLRPGFTVRSLNTRLLAQRLVSEKTPLTRYLYGVFQRSTWKTLLRYTAAWSRFRPAEIYPEFALALLLGRSSVARHVRSQLAPTTQRLLADYDGGDVLDPQLQAALTTDLNQRLLRDPSLFRRNEAEIRALPLPTAAWQLITSIYRDLLRERYSQEPDPDLRAQLLATIESAEPAETPVGDDLVRLNRLLLEAAFPYDSRQPWGFRPRHVPTLQVVREALVAEFNGLLDRPDLYREDRFDLAEEYPYLQRRYRDQLHWLNRTLLEAAFSEVEKSDVPYRERLRGLIRVLRSGASTRQGIVDIVAANLGIMGDDPQVRAARSQIVIEEYAPQLTSLFDGQISVYEEFALDGVSLGSKTPEIWVRMLPGAIKSLSNIRFIDTKTGQQVQAATPIQAGDSLVFKGSSVLLNGAAPREVLGSIPNLLPGRSRWRFEADMVFGDDEFPTGYFDQNNFDAAIWETATPTVPESELPSAYFDQNNFDEVGWAIAEPALPMEADFTPGRFDQHTFDTALWATAEPAVQVQVLTYRYTPGNFTVVIPWHIPGFTDKFAETAEHPRHQILSLVNRVKAAGIMAQVAYRQIFGETHDHDDRLELVLSSDLLAETHDIDDTLWASTTQQSREEQHIADTLSLAGHFDLTAFDSLNTFAR